MNLAQVFDRVSEGCFDDVIGLWDTDLIHGDASSLLNHLYVRLLLQCIERDTCTRATSSGSTPRSMNVSLSVFRGLNLDDQVDAWDI